MRFVVTTYEWPDLEAAHRGHFGDANERLWKYTPKKGAYRLTNSVRDGCVEIEGDRIGLLHFGINFLLACAQQDYLHLYSGTQPGGFFGPFQSGYEVTISHTARLPLRRHPPAEDGIATFRYSARPVQGPTEPLMLAESESWTLLGKDELPSSFSVTGNTPALQSYFQQLLDLAEEGTRSGTELQYSPGRQIQDDDSIPFLVRRLA